MSGRGRQYNRRLAGTILGVAAVLLAVVTLYSLWQASAAEARSLEAARVDALVLARALDALDADTYPPDGLYDAIVMSRAELAAAVYAPDGSRLAVRAAENSGPLVSRLPDRAPPDTETAYLIPAPVGKRSAGLLALRLADGRLLVTANRASAAASWLRPLVAAETLTLVVALAMATFLLRRVGGVRRRLDAEKAGAAPTREADFVVETFQSVIGELQTKGRELELQRLLESERADRSERFSERVIAQMPTGLVVVDRAGRVTAANPSARALFPSLPSERAQSMDFRTAFGEAPGLVRIVEECLREGASTQRGEVELRPNAESTRCLGASVTPLAKAGGPPEAALCLITDLTEVVALRERLRIQHSLASLGEMAAGLAHEMKNSLATIQGYGQLLARVAPESTATPSTALIDEVRYLTQMVTDFLNFARPHEPALASVPVAEVVDGATGRIAARAAEADITVTTVVDPDAGALWADETMLGRALFNLLLNAVEALEGAPPPREIVVRARRVSRGEIEIEVRDSGPGIAPEDREKIFIPFYTTKSRGYGIGLALTHKIVLTHRGSIAIEDGNPGTVFRCTLPAEGVPEAD